MLSFPQNSFQRFQSGVSWNMQFSIVFQGGQNVSTNLSDIIYQHEPNWDELLES